MSSGLEAYDDALRAALDAYDETGDEDACITAFRTAREAYIEQRQPDEVARHDQEAASMSDAKQFWNLDEVTDDDKRIENAINVSSIRKVLVQEIEGVGRDAESIAIVGSFVIGLDHTDELEKAIQDGVGFPDEKAA
jgi:hypothetical protein